VTTGDGYGDRWFDREAGPVVRPYAVTKGRTLPSGGASFGLIDVVIATDERPAVGVLVTLGTVQGRVVRHLEEGFAVEFTRLGHPDFLEESVCGP